MLSRILPSRKPDSHTDKIRLLKNALDEADAVVIGAGAGLSASAGFDKKRLFYTQGDYGLFQCSEPCCQKTWDNEAMIREMTERQTDMRIPSELVPRCPNCGKPMTMNLRADDTFVQDEGWYKASERYTGFIRSHQGMKVLYLELGAGYNTPGIVKFSFWRMTAENPKAVYACVNLGEAGAPKEIASRSICIDGDIGEVLKKLK